VTVFEEKGGDGKRSELKPVAERLVYRAPAEGLNFGIKSDRAVNVPGDRVNLKITSTNEKEEATPAIVTVAIVDKSVLTMADEKTFRSMPTHFYLTTEVRRPEDLEHADFLLTPHPKAKEALDLLLGTQGWRRFAEQNPNEFQQKHAEEAARLLVMSGQSTQKVTDFLREDFRKLEDDFQQEKLRLEEQREAAAERLKTADKTEAYVAASAKLTRYDEAWQRFWGHTAPLAAVVGLGLLVVFLAVRMLRTAARTIPFYAGAMVCAMLLMAVIVVQFAPDRREQQTALSARNMKQSGIAPVPMADMALQPDRGDKGGEMPLDEKALEAMPREAPGGMVPCRPPGRLCRCPLLRREWVAGGGRRR
jgi:hypothetical protein